MEARWICDRAALRCLLYQHPDWSTTQLAQAIGRSLSFVKKWRQRLRGAAADDVKVLRSRSRARHTPFPPPHPEVVGRILAIREQPPENLQRVPGPRTILYYLHRDPHLQALGLAPPRSSRTVWKILRKAGCILPPAERKRRPLPPREPLEEIQVDFKDISTVPADPSGEGKRQHVVEVCNFVDAGTSILLSAQAHEDFHAETALLAIVTVLRTYGRPRMITLDHDPRWIGSQSGRDFPSALRRLLLCLGITPNICPPHQPQKNAYVERYHRSYKYECVLVHRPASLQQVQEITADYHQHYNQERPHQGRACRDQPPRLAFPTLPALPALPERVDPDRWLLAYHGQMLHRKVGSDGCVDVDEHSYYLSHSLAGQSVALLINAHEDVLEVVQPLHFSKRLPIKGLIGAEMAFDAYLAMMCEQARSEERQARMKQATIRQRSLWSSP